MKFVIQRVTHAKVEVEQKIIGSIQNGYLVLIGIAEDDNEEIADKLVKKLLGLRIFADENGKTNLSLKDVNGSLLLVSQFTLYDVGGEMLIVSQFTLYADCRKGNRPSFVNAGNPEKANELYEYIIGKCRDEVPDVQTGSFGADMKITLLNDGPFTIILDSKDLI